MLNEAMYQRNEHAQNLFYVPNISVVTESKRDFFAGRTHVIVLNTNFKNLIMDKQNVLQGNL